MKGFIEIFFLKIIKKIMQMFPFNFRYKICDVMGTLAYKFGKSRRNVSKKNLKIAFPELNNEEIEKLVLISYKNIARTFMELLWLKELKVDVEGLEYLEKSLEKGKGIILVSMHLGNWECIGSGIAAKGYNIYGVAKKLKNKEVNDEINYIRTRTGLKIIEKGRSSARLFVKALKEKAIIGLISDQFTNDVEVDFFSRKTKAPAGAANFSIKFDVPVLITYSYRREDKSHVIVIEEEIKNILTGNLEDDIKNNTQRYICEMEKVIKKYPEQWFWQHKRWRD